MRVAHILYLCLIMGSHSGFMCVLHVGNVHALCCPAFVGMFAHLDQAGSAPPPPLALL